MSLRMDSRRRFVWRDSAKDKLVGYWMVNVFILMYVHVWLLAVRLVKTPGSFTGTGPEPIDQLTGGD